MIALVVPMTAIEYGPGAKLVPLITKVAVAGKVLTNGGVTLQLLAPKVAAQLRATVPVKPSWDEIVIGPLVPVLPSFTLGNALGSLSTKSGFRTTAIVNVVVNGG